MMRQSASFSAGLILVLALTAGATTIHVPADQPTIQAGIAAASAGDTVLVACGTYYEHDIVMESSVYLTSETGDPSCVIIDAQEQGRVLNCNGVDSSACIVGFTITHGRPVGDPPADWGAGALVRYGAAIRFVECEFLENHAGLFGGGVYCRTSSPEFIDCLFSGNTASIGSALACETGGSPLVSGCVFTDNDGSGGYVGTAVYCRSCTPTFEDCLISDNIGGGFGGMMFEGTTSPRVLRCTISNNTSRSAAMVFATGTTAVVEDCIIVNNHGVNGSTVFGGGIGCFGGEAGGGALPTLRRCTVVGNTTSSNVGGAAVYCGGGSPTLEECIIAFNGPGVWVQIADENSDLFLLCCDIYGNIGGDWVDDIADQFGVNGNFLADPLFYDPDGGDYHLLPTSPCADVADCGRIGALGVTFPEYPTIASVSDVADDQGRQVRLTWAKSLYDSPADTVELVGYEVYRRQDEYLSFLGHSDPDRVAGSDASDNQRIDGWDYVATVPALWESVYQFTAPTLCDSTEQGGICWSAFFVRAATESPWLYFDSAPDSGYSIDNIAPAAPTGLEASGGIEQVSLTWVANSEPDLQMYAVYRDTVDSQALGALLGYAVEASFDDNAPPNASDCWYRVTAQDFGGNVSAPSAPAQMHLFDPEELSLVPEQLSFGVPENGTAVDGVELHNNGGLYLTWSASEDCEWLSMSSYAGVVAPAAYDDVTVSVDAAGLSTGLYAYSVLFSSSDPADPVDTLSVSLAVLGPPVIALNPDSLSFLVPPDGTDCDTVSVANVGEFELSWSVIEECDWITCAPLSGVVAPADTQDCEFDVDASGLSSGTYACAVLFTSNDPLSPTDTVDVSLVVASPPDIVVAPDSLWFQVIEGASAFDTLTISNSGDIELIWSLVDTCSWLTAFPDSGALLGHSAIDVEVTADAYGLPQALYESILGIASDDPNEPLIEVPVGLNIVGPSHFEPVYEGNPYLPMNINILTVQIHEIDADVGDEIGIYDGTYCVGAGVVDHIITPQDMLYLVASADDPETPEVDGFTNGNAIEFRIWDASEQAETSAWAAFWSEPDVPADGIFQQQGTIYADVYTLLSQAIWLASGWNIMSFNVEPEEDLLTVVTPILPNLSRIVAETGDAIFYNAFTEEWVNNIGDANIWDGYYTRMNSSAELDVNGTVILYPVTDTLDAGWNITGFPYFQPRDAEAVFGDLILGGYLDKVQDEAGNALFYDPYSMQWVNLIGDMEPGEGYYASVNTDCELLFPEVVRGLPQYAFGEAEEADSAGLENERDESRTERGHFQVVYEGNPYLPMLVNAISVTLDGEDMTAGDEVGLFDGDICVGAEVITGPVSPSDLLSIPASCDNPETPEVDGFVSGNPVLIRVWDSADETECEASGQFWDSPGVLGDTTYVAQGFIYVDVAAESSSGVDDPDESGSVTSTRLHPSIPNPFNPSTRIVFDLGEPQDVSIAVYSLDGRLVARLLDRYVERGRHEVPWDGRNAQGRHVPSGVYFCRLEAGSHVETRRMTVLR